MHQIHYAADDTGVDQPLWKPALRAYRSAFGPSLRHSLHNGPAKPPVKRIDYIFAAGPVAAKVTEVRVLWEGRFRADSAAANPAYALSDHLPLLAVFGPSSRKN